MNEVKTFATAINCMDGRVQQPVLDFITKNYDVDLVDMITDAGPLKYLVDYCNDDKFSQIFENVEISIEAHGSKKLFIIGHHDCKGNPVDRQTQEEQIKISIDRFAKILDKKIEIYGVYFDENWQGNIVEV